MKDFWGDTVKQRRFSMGVAKIIMVIERPKIEKKKKKKVYVTPSPKRNIGRYRDDFAEV